MNRTRIPLIAARVAEQIAAVHGVERTPTQVWLYALWRASHLRGAAKHKYATCILNQVKACHHAQTVAATELELSVGFEWSL